jgi:hypothetical protein
MREASPGYPLGCSIPLSRVETAATRALTDYFETISKSAKI